MNIATHGFGGTSESTTRNNLPVYGFSGVEAVVVATIVTTNIFSLLYDIKTPDVAISCDNESSDFLLEYASTDYDRPFKRLHTQDTTQTTIEMSYVQNINGIFLGNCNFSSFKIEIDDVEHALSTIQDKDSGLYNAYVRLTGNISQFNIIIPNQSTTNGESFFAIGSIVAGIRSDFTSNPQYILKKELIKNIFERYFDGEIREVQSIGKPYHLIEFNWNALLDADFDKIEDALQGIGQDGEVVVYEKYSDNEVAYLCQIYDDVAFSRIMSNKSKSSLKFREIM